MNRYFVYRIVGSSVIKILETPPKLEDIPSLIAQIETMNDIPDIQGNFIQANSPPETIQKALNLKLFK